MTPALRQLRDGIRAHIAEDPTIVKVNHYPLIDDGYGNMVPDTTGTPEEVKARVRLQHESSGVQANQIGPSGLDTNLSLYVLTDHRAPLLEGDQFSALGFTWTVGPVNEFRRHGGMYKTEAPLSKGSAVGVTVPTDFAAEALSNTEIDLTWDDVGAVNT